MIYYLNLIGRFTNVVCIIILAIGTFWLFMQRNSTTIWCSIYVFSLLAIEVTAMYMGVYLDKNVLFLLTTSFFIHYLMLSTFYSSFITRGIIYKSHVIWMIGLLPFVLVLGGDREWNFLIYNSRFYYSLFIISYSLLYFYHLLRDRLTKSNPKTILNGTILLFFSVDTFLAMGTEYLVKESLLLVSWFWSTRALTLILFYLALINYGLKANPTTQNS